MTRDEMLKRLKAGEDPLELSIQKWRDIVEGKGEDLGINNCALCEKFENCQACFNYCGMDCLSGPYQDWLKQTVVSSETEKFPENKKPAQAMVDYLISKRERRGERRENAV